MSIPCQFCGYCHNPVSCKTYSKSLSYIFSLFHYLEFFKLSRSYLDSSVDVTTLFSFPHIHGSKCVIFNLPFLIYSGEKSRSKKWELYNKQGFLHNREGVMLWNESSMYIKNQMHIYFDIVSLWFNSNISLSLSLFPFLSVSL